VRGEKRRNRSSGRAAQDRSGRRRDMKRKTLNLLNLKEKLTKIFSYAELLSLKLKSDYQRVPYN